MSSNPFQPTVAAVVVAAGQGLRANQPLPKQFAIWRGKPVIRHSIEALLNSGIGPVIVVVPANLEHAAAVALGDISHRVSFVAGGETRQQSVRNGLEALITDAPDYVFIHDAARPGLSSDVIDRLRLVLSTNDAAIPVLPVFDSLVHAHGGTMGEPARREELRRVQTPQAFHYHRILSAHQSWKGQATAGDDAQVAQAAGMTITLIEGDEALHKLTVPLDFASSMPPIRVGSGYDVHQLVQGKELWLCGVQIQHDWGLAGHSDADVAIHALVDAILGALGEGDIGQHFPPSDPQWRGASSDRFLAHAALLTAQAGYRLGNADVTIICEAPKIGPHREAMRERLAAILGVDKGLISVKATTTEKLGFTGRSEGIAAQAMVSLIRN